jgi:hypothetical protein
MTDAWPFGVVVVIWPLIALLAVRESGQPC